jgi:hypothetical protein
MRYAVKFANFLKVESKKIDEADSNSYIEYTNKRIDNCTKDLDFEKMLVIYCELFPNESKNIKKYFRFSSTANLTHQRFKND